MKATVEVENRKEADAQAPAPAGRIAEIARRHADCVDNPAVCCQIGAPDSCDVPWLLRSVASLFDAIAHGDGEHRAWLKAAIIAHFDGRPVPAATGAGEKDVLREQLLSAQAEVTRLMAYQCDECDSRTDADKDEISRIKSLIAEAREALIESGKAGRLLFANTIASIKHQDPAFDETNLPGWLKDTAVKICRAAEVLRKMERTNG